jgi:hypothetical protein
VLQWEWFRRVLNGLDGPIGSPAGRGPAIAPIAYPSLSTSTLGPVSRVVQSCAIPILTRRDALELFKSTREMALIRVSKLKSDLRN